MTLIELGRRQPYRYALMFSAPAVDPEAAAAASRLQSQFIEIVADLVGERDALRYGALVMSGAHGIAALELSGHLEKEKWKVSGEQLVQSLVSAIQSDLGVETRERSRTHDRPHHVRGARSMPIP